MYVLYHHEALELAYSIIESYEMLSSDGVQAVCLEKMGITFVATDETETSETVFKIVRE